MSYLKLICGLTLAALAVSSGAVQAQDFPNRPITVELPFPPGGLADLVARRLSQKVQEGLGQQLIDAGKPTEGQQQLAFSRQLLDTAVQLDPSYLYARVYRSFVALAQNQPKDADADLKVYEAASDQPLDLQLLVPGLRDEIDKQLKK